MGLIVHPEYARRRRRAIRRGAAFNLLNQRVPFSPLDLANLLAWYDANDLTTLWQEDGRTTQVTTDAQAIGSWDDKSGNGEHATQGTAGNRPLYKTGIINSLPVVRGDGTNDVLTGISITQAAPQHCYAVVDTTNLGTGDRVLFERSVSWDRPACFLGSVEDPPNRDRVPVAAWANDQAVWGSSVTRAAVFRWRFGSSDTGIRVDDGIEVTGGVDAGLGSWASLLGGDSGRYAAADAGEIILAGAVTAAEDTSLMSYLNNKWAIY